MYGCVLQMFSQFGPVVDLSLIRDRQDGGGAFKGCAFVRMQSITDADRAIRHLDSAYSQIGSDQEHASSQVSKMARGRLVFFLSQTQDTTGMLLHRSVSLLLASSGLAQPSGLPQTHECHCVFFCVNCLLFRFEDDLFCVHPLFCFGFAVLSSMLAR